MSTAKQYWETKAARKIGQSLQCAGPRRHNPRTITGAKQYEASLSASRALPTDVNPRRTT
jgi:hypothetical protein